MKPHLVYFADNIAYYTRTLFSWLFLSRDGQGLLEMRTEYANDVLLKARQQGKLYYSAPTVRFFRSPTLTVLDPSTLTMQSIQKISSGTTDPRAREPFANFKEMLDLGDETPLSWVFKQDQMAYDSRQLLANLMRPNRFTELDQIITETLVAELPRLKNPPTDFCLYQWVHQLTMRIIAKHVLGLNYFPSHAHAVLDKAEAAIVRETKPWQILGYPIALTSSQQNYQNAKRDFRQLADELVEKNFEAIRTGNSYLSQVLAILAKERAMTQSEALHLPEVKHILSCAAAGLLFASGTLSTSLTMGLLHLDEEFAQQFKSQALGKTPNEFVEAFFKEALRNTSSAAHNLRLASETMELTTEDGTSITIHPNSYLVMDLRRSHQNTQTWGDPENFRPERFFSNAAPGLNSTKFCPFSLGNRMCPGRLVAEQIFKGVILFMLKNQIFILAKDPEFKKIINEDYWTNRDFVTRLRANMKIQVSILCKAPLEETENQSISSFVKGSIKTI